MTVFFVFLIATAAYTMTIALKKLKEVNNSRIEREIELVRRVVCTSLLVSSNQGLVSDSIAEMRDLLLEEGDEETKKKVLEEVIDIFEELRRLQELKDSPYISENLDLVKLNTFFENLKSLQ